MAIIMTGNRNHTLSQNNLLTNQDRTTQAIQNISVTSHQSVVTFHAKATE
jgi:hypothetical protein